MKNRVQIMMAVAAGVCGTALLLTLTNLSPQPSAIRQDQQPETVKPEDRQAAFDPLQFFSMARAYPSTDVPPAAMGKAWDYYRTAFTDNRARAASPRMVPWQSMGPVNRGGRTVSIAVDPNDTQVIWLGSASGGLWKSTTGGTGSNAWTYIPTGFPVLGVGAIALNPANSQIIYIGTGETYSYGSSGKGIIDRPTRGSYGMGIYKSTDGGQTWSLSLNWTYQQNRGVSDLVMNLADPNILYAATTEGIYKSGDAGQTWKLVLNQLMAMDIATDEGNSQVLYAGVGNMNTTGKGIYKSTDGGETWTLLSGNGLPAYNHTGRIIVSTHHNAGTGTTTIMAMISNTFSTVGTYKSTDGGASWTFVNNKNITGIQGWYCKGLFMKKDDPSRVLMGGVKFYASSDGGATSSTVSGPHDDIHDIVGHPTDPNKVYVITDGGLYLSNDFGATFSDANGGYQTSQFYMGGVSSSDPNRALGGLQDNGTKQYVGSKAWNSVIGADGAYTIIDPSNDSYQYGATQYLSIRRSSDRGNTFTTLTSQSTTAFLAPYVLCTSNTQTLYKADLGLMVSTNRGTNWSSVGPDPIDPGNPVLTIGVSHTTVDTVYCATAPYQSRSKVFRSANGGQNWQEITGSLPDRYPRRITVHPTNSRILYIAYAGFGTGHLFKSTDAGATWQDISTALPDVPFHVVAIDPFNTDILYAGSDLSTYVSLDGGQSWSAFAEGLPEACMVYDLNISRSDSTLVAFTHGSGVWKTGLIQFNPTTGITGQVIDAETKLPIPDAHVTLRGKSNSFDAKTDINGNFSLASIVPFGSYDVVAGKWSYVTNGLTQSQIDTVNNRFVIELTPGYYDDFIFDFKWMQSGTATSGRWERGEPAGTVNGADTSNPDLDVATDYGDEAYVTGNGGGNAGNDDIDGGNVVLVSPVMDLSNHLHPKLHYHHWFYTGGGGGAPTDDYFVIRITNGTDTVTLDSVTANTSWAYKSYRLNDYLSSSANMQAIFEAADILTGHITEAGLDLFRITDSIPKPIALFQADKDTVCLGEAVQFTDLSSHTPTAWRWNFGDGNTSAVPNPVHNYSTPGTYSVQLRVENKGGPDSLLQSQLVTVLDTPAPVLVLAFNTLVVTNVVNGVTYQWFLDGNLIPGAVTSTHIVTQNGTYRVHVTQANQCSGLSDTLAVHNVGIREATGGLAWNIYPNPAGEFVQVHFVLEKPQNYHIRLLNILGKAVLHTEGNGNGIRVERLDLRGLPTGTYLLELQVEGHTVHKKVMHR